MFLCVYVRVCVCVCISVFPRVQKDFMLVLPSNAPAVSRQQQKAFWARVMKRGRREKDSQAEREMTERKSERMIERVHNRCIQSL